MKQLFAFLFLIACLLGLPRQARSETIFALTNSNQLLSFDSATPGTTSALVPVTGPLPGEALVGIDFRPAVSAQLLGAGQVGTTGTVYTSNSVTGPATSINRIPTLLDQPVLLELNHVPDA